MIRRGRAVYGPEALSPGDRVAISKTACPLPLYLHMTAATFLRLNRRKNAVLRFDGYEREYTAPAWTLCFIEEPE